MSKQEILSWTSLATSTSVLVFYILFNFSWPDVIPNYTDSFASIFFNVFWIAVVIEAFVQISEGKKKVQKDERDFLIEAKGLKAGYGILTVTMMVVLVQLFIYNFTENYVSQLSYTIEISTIINVLFIALFASSAAKRITMIYNYRKDS